MLDVFAAAFRTSRHYILFTAMGCLCVLLGGAFDAGGVVDAGGFVAAHVAIEPVDTAASAGENSGPDVPGDGGEPAPGANPVAGDSTADPSTNPTLKPAAATKTVTTTTVTRTTLVKASKPKTATATSSTLPKTGDSDWIAVSQVVFLLGTALLSIVHDF